MTDTVGVVPVDGRGSLPFALLHGESLVAVASWVVGEADVRLLDFDEPWSSVVDSGLPLLVHDPLCPGTPVGFVHDVLDRAERSGAVVVAVRPVTDTVKQRDGDLVGRTVDRSELVALASPVVLPSAVVAGLSAAGLAAQDGWPLLDDLAAFVERLRDHFPVEYVVAPAEARRVADESDLAVLAAALPSDETRG